ncbi:MAG: helix-turn-helix domain-containing protein, partial [Anderseniella sp.]
RKFGQLLEGLRGIGPNLLSDRLSQFQELGIIQKQNENEHKGSGHYILTESGKGLEPILLDIVRWSLTHLPNESSGKIRRDELLVVAFRACFVPCSTSQFDEEYEFRIGQVSFVVKINGQKLTSHLGQSNNPAFVFITDSETFDQIFHGDRQLQLAEKSGELKIIGNRKAYSRWQNMLVLGNGRVA